MTPPPLLHMVPGQWSPNENTTTGITSNTQLTIYNTLKDKAYTVTVRANYPSATGLSGNKQYVMDITPAANSVSFGISAYLASANSIVLTLNGNKESSIAIPRNAYGTWNFTVTIVQQSNASNTASATTPDLRIFPLGTTLPETFTANYNGGVYNGLFQAYPSHYISIFVINETKLPFIADNVIVRGGDDNLSVGNWKWAAPNKTNSNSTSVNFLPLVGCKKVGTNGSPSFINLIVTGATENSLAFNVSGGCGSNPAQTRYKITAISENTGIYGAWKITSNDYEYGGNSKTISTPYDGHFDIPFTGVYKGYYYKNVTLINETSTSLLLTILPGIQAPKIKAYPSSLPIGSNIMINAIPSGGESPYTYNFMIYDSSSGKLVASSGSITSNSFNYSPNNPGNYLASVTVTDHLGFSKNSTKVQFSVSAPQQQYSCASGTQLSILSNASTLANGPDTNSIWTNATPTYSKNPSWTASIPGATWIWDNYTVSNPAENQTVQFKREFSIPGTVKDAILKIATDNDGKFSINSKTSASWVTSDLSYYAATSFNVTNVIAKGSNLIHFNVTNIGIAGSTPELNPAGLLYNLTICYAPVQFNNSNVHVSIPDSVIDTGQNEAITATVTGGVTPYTSYAWKLNGNAIGTNSPSLKFSGNSSDIGNDIITVTVTDSAGQTGTGTGSVRVNSLPSFGTPGIKIPDSTIEIGSSEIVTAKETGGTAPFTYSWTENGNPVSGDTSNQLTFNAKVAGANVIGVKVVDARGISALANGIVTVVTGISFGTPQIDIPNSILSTGQTETITANVLGGVLPYASFVWTDNGNVIPANTQSITFTGAANDLGLNNLHVTMTDSAGNNAVGTGTVNVINAAEITLTPATSSVTSGSSVTYTVTITGGIGPFNIELYNITGSKQQGSNVTIATPGGSNTVTFTTGPTGTFTYNAMATDTATNTIFGSPNAVLTVNQKPTGCTSNCGGGSGGGGGGGGGGGNFVPTVNTSGNCTTISNFSQDNSESFKLKGRSFDVTLNSISPTQVDVTINGYTYTLDANNKTKLTGLANYTIDLTSISYLPIVHTVTIELCYSSISTGPKQSSGPEGSMIVSLTTNKTISVQNGQVLLTGSITNGTAGPYTYTFVVKNSTGKVVFSHTNTNSKTSNSTVFTPTVPGIYAAAVHITTDGTTGNSNSKSLTVSALQETTTAVTTIATTTVKPAAPPASASSWLILLMIILIIIVLLALYYYMRRQQKKGKR